MRTTRRAIWPLDGRSVPDTVELPYQYLSSSQADWEDLAAEAVLEPAQLHGWKRPATPDLRLMLFSGGPLRFDPARGVDHGAAPVVREGDLVLRSGVEPYEVGWRRLSSAPTRAPVLHLDRDLVLRAAEGLDCRDPSRIALPDLVGFQMGLSSIVGALYMVQGGNVFLGIVIMIVIGVAFGLSNGFCVVRLRMVPFIVTMSVMIVNTGISTWITPNGSFGNLPKAYLMIAQAGILGIPLPVLSIVVLLIGSYVVLRRSFVGKLLYATGVNQAAATICGIKTNRYVFLSYCFGALFAALAGILMTSRMAMVVSPSASAKWLSYSATDSQRERSPSA
jgi:hypothetical protein